MQLIMRKIILLSPFVDGRRPLPQFTTHSLLWESPARMRFTIHSKSNWGWQEPGASCPTHRAGHIKDGMLLHEVVETPDQVGGDI